MQASAAVLCSESGSAGGQGRSSAEPGAARDGRGGATNPAENPVKGSVGGTCGESLYNVRALQLWLLHCCQARPPHVLLDLENDI